MDDGGPLVAGIDLGTTSAKGAVFTLAGRCVAEARRDYPLARPQPGWAEQDPRHWLEAARGILAALRAVGGDRIRALGICSQVNTHVFVDDAGAALAPAIVWQDQRCAQIAARLRKVSGVAIDASHLVARAAWCAERRPEIWARTAWVLSPKDYCNLALTGRVATDGISSIGLVDAAGTRYAREIVGLVPDLERRLPPLRRLTEMLGAADDGLQVVVGAMDAWGNLVGSGATRPGQGIEVAGTSEIVALVSAERHPEPGIVSFPPVDGRHVHAGPTQAGGDALRWVAAVLGRSIGEALELAACARPEAGSLLFLPHLMGERAPLWDPRARGAFVGLTLDHDAGELVRAVLEGVAFSARHLLEAASRAAAREYRMLRVSGGGARSALWCQIKADALGRRLERVAYADSAVLGAALMAGVGAGLIASLDAAAATVRIERVFEPDGAARTRYERLYHLYRETYAGLAPVFAALAGEGDGRSR